MSPVDNRRKGKRIDPMDWRHLQKEHPNRDHHWRVDADRPHRLVGSQSRNPAQRGRGPVNAMASQAIQIGRVEERVNSNADAIKDIKEARRARTRAP
ncbi:hypothetical protein ACQR2B_27955 [Bradyrhizobium oligotrophicum]|uniref:hypothetical protein n=1 Tax=Bradyrhizobium TaxID=374 RepID=UPI003EBE4D46